MKLLKHLLLWFSLLYCTTVQAKTLHMVTDEWCPYVCDVSSPKPGIVVEALHLALEDSKYLAKVQIVNWAQAIRQVRLGKKDALLGTYKMDAPDFKFLAQPIVTSQNCFFTANDDAWQYNGIESLQQVRIAIMNSYSYGHIIDEQIHQAKTSDNNPFFPVSGTDAETRRLQMLAQKRVDVILEDKRVLPQIVKDTGSPLKIRNAGCLKPEGVTIGFSPVVNGNDAIIDLLDKSLDTLRRSGKLRDIIGNYEPNS